MARVVLGPRCPGGGVEGTRKQEGLGEGARCGATAPRDRNRDGAAPPVGGGRGRAGKKGAGCCHLSGGEGGQLAH